MTSSEAYVTLSLFETTPKQFVESSKPCAGEKMKVEFHGRRKKKNLLLLLLTRQPLCGPEGKHVLTPYSPPWIGRWPPALQCVQFDETNAKRSGNQWRAGKTDRTQNATLKPPDRTRTEKTRGKNQPRTTHRTHKLKQRRTKATQSVMLVLLEWKGLLNQVCWSSGVL